MHWIVASLVSALFLGVYELCTKHAVRDNAVVPVLFFSTLSGATVWLVLLVGQTVQPGTLPTSLVVDPLTLVGAVVVLGERPTWLETVGVLTTLASFVGLSVAGAKEGVHFHKNKWVGFLIVGTLFGAVSSLYDKYLLGRAHFSVPTVQAWFSVYLLVIFTPFAIGWKRRWWSRNEFHWRWSIPCIAFSLLVADYIYFSALRDPASLVSIVMSLRRGSTLVGFAGGLLLFGEKNALQKLPAVIGILVGIVLTVMG